MERQSKYIPGTSHLIDYAIENYGAVVIDYVGNEPVTRPPFPCLTGASNTSSSFKIDQSVYPNVLAAGV